MTVGEQDFFRQATLRICGNLDFEIALQDCFLFLKSFIPGDVLNLNLFDRGLGALRTIVSVSENEALKTNIIRQLSEEGILFLNDPNLPAARIINRPLLDPVCRPLCTQMLELKNSSILVMYLEIKGEKIGNVNIISSGCDCYTEEHLRLLLTLNEPFAIALSNWLRYEEVIQLKEMLSDDLRYLHKELQRASEDGIVGGEFGLKSTIDMVKEVAPMDSPVLLQGETGVGKEVIANAIHSLSARRNGPFIRVNCGAIPETLIDSELFGHEKGAFTGAIALKRGCFERAHGGTIFLDEVAELPPQAQVRLLRVLQEKEIVRVGGTKEIKVDIRIISATHQNLQDMVKIGKFRSDLWFRLHVFPIMIPPLRERRDDIPALVDYFLKKKSKELKLKDIPKIASGAMGPLMSYAWPGNVRELENVIERALILSKGHPLKFTEILWPDMSTHPKVSAPLPPENGKLDLVMGNHLRQIMKMTGGKINGPRGAAEILDINPGTLRHRLKILGIPFGRGVYGQRQ